ncbi:MAG: PBP1A family penicillin-binding protein [Desulfuromonadia bacterium]
MPILLLIVVLVVSTLSPSVAEEPVARFPLLPSGFQPVRVFDRHGTFVGRILPERRYWTPLERIPLFLQKAVVAVEDARFYEHPGIDVKGIARALVKDVIKGRLVEGGSTITQQLVKNRHLSAEKSIDRKIEEARLAIDYEKRYTKQQILEMYLNEIYYGNGAWGIAQAARLYFDKEPEALTEGECLVLAGIPKNPGRYNPRGKAEDVNRRRDVVLKRMEELGIITAAKRRALRATRVVYTPPDQTSEYLALVRERLQGRYGTEIIERGGIEVTASLDLRLQKIAEQVIRTGVRRRDPSLQGALVAVDPNTGDILAMVGGIDYPKDTFNRALLGRRQPGSAIKPFLLAAAVEQGVTAVDLLDDDPVSYPAGGGKVWTPQNYGDERFGVLSLRRAIAISNNVIAVKLLDRIGIDPFVSTLERVGIQVSERDLTLSLGTSPVSLHDLVRGYIPFANGGTFVDTRVIVRIYDRIFRQWQETGVFARGALAPATSFIVTSILRDVLTDGTARSARALARTHPLAGKTGTTTDGRDAWFVGYAPDLLAGVWVGYDRGKTGGKGFTGASVALPLWRQFMERFLEKRSPLDFPVPHEVVRVRIDPDTGCRVDEGVADGVMEYFAPGTEGVTLCDELPDGEGGGTPSPPAEGGTEPAPGAEGGVSR